MSDFPDEVVRYTAATAFSFCFGSFAWWEVSCHEPQTAMWVRFTVRNWELLPEASDKLRLPANNLVSEPSWKPLVKPSVDFTPSLWFSLCDFKSDTQSSWSHLWPPKKKIKNKWDLKYVSTLSREPSAPTEGLNGGLREIWRDRSKGNLLSCVKKLHSTVSWVYMESRKMDHRWLS